MRPPGFGVEGASISFIWSVLPVLLQKSYLQLVILCVVQTESKYLTRFVVICFHRLNVDRMYRYMYLDNFQTEALKTEPFFWFSSSLRWRISTPLNARTGLRPHSSKRKWKKIKKEKNWTADEQEQIMKNRAHKGDKLNLWKEEDMEAAVKEWVQFIFWLIQFKLQQNTELDAWFRM